jgi:small-conductance mechanosensitive channel
MQLPAWVDQQLFGVSLLDWAISAAILAISLLVLVALRRLLRSRLAKIAERKSTTAPRVARRVVGRTQGWFLVLVSAYFAMRFGGIVDSLPPIVHTVIKIGLLIQMGLWGAAGIGRFIELRREARLEEDAGAVAAMDIVGFLLRVAAWTIVLLLALDNLGVNITALVAGLGVGGIAVALAAQNILGDLFASLSIVLDKPFVVGDFLIIGEFMGNVEQVGIKTTRIRALSGEQLVFSNTDLLGARIRNYGRMYERRVEFHLGVTYQTPSDKLEKIPQIIKAIIDDLDNARFDRAHFEKYGDFALIFEIIYFVEAPEYRLYMDVQQAVNLEIYRRFDEEGIEFAYPTQTLHLVRAASGGEG